ncbi:PadR family transcriptional regulator [Alicyclobacillus macrosporangiidus]|uniref:PadR family transcriptional regulator n=1 Tax=Alicyclobacillus macrosporangiidus TaxID=392015 RepID=UPI0009DFF081|nr:PadR family transcriptional regulator [Alicyclobacillus macrosporangiidus]
MDQRYTQLLKGTLDMCLLSIIAQAPSYGYEMVQKLQQYGMELVSEGSIYPLLSRLERSGLIQGRFVPSEMGPPRKYYHILPGGREGLARWAEEWWRFSAAVDAVLRPWKEGVLRSQGEMEGCLDESHKPGSR